jgi:hypothetical protein
MFPVMVSIQAFSRGSGDTLHTDRDDTRTCFCDMTVAEPGTNVSDAQRPDSTYHYHSPYCLPANSRPLAFQQRLQHVRTQLATISNDIRRFFPGVKSKN